jgi:hypothetical protein
MMQTEMKDVSRFARNAAGGPRCRLVAVRRDPHRCEEGTDGGRGLHGAFHLRIRRMEGL